MRFCENFVPSYLYKMYEILRELRTEELLVWGVWDFLRGLRIELLVWDVEVYARVTYRAISMRCWDVWECIDAMLRRRKRRNVRSKQSCCDVSSFKNKFFVQVRWYIRSLVQKNFFRSSTKIHMLVSAEKELRGWKFWCSWNLQLKNYMYEKIFNCYSADTLTTQKFDRESDKMVDNPNICPRSRRNGIKSSDCESRFHSSFPDLSMHSISYLVKKMWKSSLYSWKTWKFS